MKIFYVYLDWTLEEKSRCFYVGKGNEERVRKRERNEYWRAIAAKYGWRREKIVATLDESYSYEQEQEWIARMRTFEGAGEGCWGANLTVGGSGVMTGRKHSAETLMKMRGSNHHCFGKFGPEHPAFGNKMTEEWKAARSGENSSSKRPEVRAKIGLASRGRKLTAEVIAKRSGENSNFAVLTAQQVQEIRRRYAAEKKTQSRPGVKVKGITQLELAKEYGVRQTTISDIVTRKIWKELE